MIPAEGPSGSALGERRDLRVFFDFVPIDNFGVAKKPVWDDSLLADIANPPRPRGFGNPHHRQSPKTQNMGADKGSPTSVMNTRIAFTTGKTQEINFTKLNTAFAYNTNQVIHIINHLFVVMM
jgi:hypothetical protein